MIIPSDLIVDDHKHLVSVTRARKPLIEMLQKSEGKTHLEIGSRIGASAIIASGYTESITCIDPMESLGPVPETEGVMYELKDLGIEKYFWLNMDRWGITDKVELIVALSFPFPADLEDRTWDTAFVDGIHTVEGMYQDMKSLEHRINIAMIIDDNPHNAVERFLGETDLWEQRTPMARSAVTLWRKDA